jgi:hypothetical protein
MGILMASSVVAVTSSVPKDTKGVHHFIDDALRTMANNIF